MSVFTLSLSSIILLCLSSALLAGLAAVLVYEGFIVKKRAALARRTGYVERELESGLKEKEIIGGHKETEEYRGILENRYLKGVRDGEKKALAAFSLSYTPFVEITDGFLRHAADAGYTMQIFYNGLPLGDQMKRVTRHEEKFRDENLERLIETVTATLQNLMLLADPLGIPVRIVRNPQIERKRKN